MPTSTTRPSRTVHQHLASKLNLRQRPLDVPPELRAKWDAQKQQTPRLGVQTDPDKALPLVKYMDIKTADTCTFDDLLKPVQKR